MIHHVNRLRVDRKFTPSGSHEGIVGSYFLTAGRQASIDY